MISIRVHSVLVLAFLTIFTPSSSLSSKDILTLRGTAVRTLWVAYRELTLDLQKDNVTSRTADDYGFTLRSNGGNYEIYAYPRSANIRDGDITYVISPSTNEVLFKKRGG